jgi:hypothetical protein
MKYVETYNQKSETPESESAEYNKLGDIVESEKETVYAKCQQVFLRDATQNQFYVLVANGNLLDPRGTDSHRINTLKKELRKTNKQTFDYYLKYLQSKNTLFLRRAERSYING